MGAVHCARKEKDRLAKRIVRPKHRIVKSYHGAPCEKYHQSLQELDNDEIDKWNVDHSQVEYLGVGAGISGGFENTEKNSSQ